MATKFNLNDCTPCMAIHPGEILKDELNARGMRQKELALLMGIPTSVLSNILKGYRSISPELAVLLQEILDIDASYWLSLQNQYDIDKANIDAKIIEKKKNLEIWKIISQYCAVKSLEKLNVIGSKIADNINTIYKIFGVSSVESLVDLFSQEKEVAYFRKSEKLTCDPISIFSWKYYAFYESSKLDCPVKFKKEDLQSLVNELNQLFEANQNTIELTKEILGRYGIKFIVLPKFDKTPVDGFSFWQGDNPTIVLTLRLNRIDNYAFSLMHEIWHVYAHLINNKEDRFIAIEGAKLDKCEDEANKFAKNALINKEIWANFLNQYSRISPHAMQEKIKSFARLHHINEAIVLGFYQHDINLYSMKSSISREIK
jgi:HTH-type transcriptional regulator/antitoxin HigA